MKKNLFALFLIPTIIIAGCTDSGVKINSEDRTSKEWLSVEQAFNKQLDETQYIKDLEDFFSYNILLNTDGTPYVSTFSFDVDFDEKSSVQWWLEFSQKSAIKSKDLEKIDMQFNLEARQNPSDSEPVYSSWDITLLYQDGEMFANVHDFVVSMGEGNMTAKMYTLLLDMIKDKWVDLEVNNWWIISIDKDEDVKIPYIIWTLKNVLGIEDVQSNPNFLNSVAEIIDIINSHIDLWISTNELSLISYEIQNSELSDKTIQKTFTWSFQWKDSAFNLSFTVSKKWLDVYFYNISEYDTDIQNYRNTDSGILFSIQEKGKSKYSVVFQSIKSKQKVVDLQWKIEYWDETEFSANFILEPIELMAWQKISWKIKGSITKTPRESKIEIPEITWDILSLSELLSSL